VTNKPDIQHVLDRWFEEGPLVVPEHVIDGALEIIDETKQRRVWGASRRYRTMSNFAKVAAAGVLILVVAVVALGVANLIAVPPVGTASQSPAPSEAGRASPTSEPTVPLPRSASWSATGSLATKRESHTATLLDDGKVLVVGGNVHLGLLDSAELYDPMTGVWRPTGSLNVAREFHAATRLADGRVLVVGGYSQPNTLASAELYDPRTETWSVTGSMATPRAMSTATLLSNGRVLVVGGVILGGQVIESLASAELYDPVTGEWTATGNLATGREDHTATRLADGSVIVVGGSHERDGEPIEVLNSAELYDPRSGAWTSAGTMSAARTSHTATLLASGEVLVAGGYSTAAGDAFPAAAELYDPSTGSWKVTGSMTAVRVNATATLLPDGRVLLAGGADTGDVVASAEIYDPGTGSWVATAKMVTGRDGHEAVLLDDGRVLVVGGHRTNPTDALASAELYDPGSGS
jgi:N-acetylneuraminic acid mutarotase